ncbi:HD domain-containing protein [Paenibacillus sp. NPDC056579]|uniref:HD domain-containing protein n=1 Tax=unclassified Paenibacillus TaxID=185978 RepID=UPI001EF8C2B9|nr:HD domain-containing protein [Paenibacillus sp. H1-7]ULL15127.1 HD domain-containing protein [Paenibacillus sp. H1-7]
MNKETILLEAAAFAKKELEADSSGHDWWHIARVARTARLLAMEEQADLFVCELAALLHDVADEKLNPSAEAGMNKVRNWLQAHDTEEKVANHVLEIIATISYKGGHNRPVTTKEAQVVQDADRLDALGAIGIARTFAYAGWKGHLIYDPEQPVRTEITYEEYRKGEASAVHHFYEKLFKLADLMNTDSGKRLAKSRHRFMEQYLQQFYNEWNGENV